MLEYELAILQYMVKEFDIDIWGVSVNGIKPAALDINGEKYPIHIYANVNTGKRIIPNYYRGLELCFIRKEEFDKYDVVYAHTGSCAVAISRIINKDRTKLVVHQHGLNYLTDYSLMSLIQRPLMALARKEAELLFLVSDEESVREYAKSQRKWIKAQVEAVKSPINLSKFNEGKIRGRIAERDGKRSSKFIYTGRLTSYKNVHTAVNAFARYVRNVNPDAEFRIFGSGEEESVIQQQIKHYGLQKNIYLMGAIPHDELYPYLEDADVFLTASGGEGVSVSVLEAYAAGLPVVCFKVRGLEGQVIDHKTGVFALNRSSKGFYRAMLEVEKYRTQLASDCLEEAKKYDNAIIAGHITDKIMRLIQ